MPEIRHKDVKVYDNVQYAKFTRANGNFLNEEPDYIWENAYVDLSGNTYANGNTDNDFIPISELDVFINDVAEKASYIINNSYSLDDEHINIINSYIADFINGSISELSVEMPLVEKELQLYTPYDISECAYHICSENISFIENE